MTPEELAFILGQGLGAVAVILGFISFQMKTPGRILVFQIVTASLFALHYLLIGAYPAVWLNLLAVLQCAVYYLLGRRGGAGRLIPCLFVLAAVCASLLTWSGWYTVLIMLGVAVNALGLALSRAEGIRAVQLVKAPLCLSYNVIVFSIGGAVYELAVLISSLIGLVRDRRAARCAKGQF